MKTIEYIKKGLTDTFIIWRNELESVFKDAGVVIFFLVVPLAYPVIYGLIYNTETVREVPMVVVEESHSSLAREMVRKIDGTPDVRVVQYAASMEEARRLVDEKQAYGILRIPSDFSKKIHRGQQATVGLYVDMSGLLYYKALLLATTEASMAMRSEIQVQSVDMPVPYESVALYNPQNGFASFLLPGIVVLVIQQTLLLGISMLAATNRERNRNHRLIPFNESYFGSHRVVFGKALAYLSIYVFVTLWALIVVPKLFNIPQLAHFGNLLLFTLPLLLACVFFAMLISTFVRGRETPMMIFVFASLPLLFLSGISWPQSAIPELWRYISYLFPSTFGIQGFVKLNSMGASLAEVAFEYKSLWVQTGVYFIATFLVYRYQSLLTQRDK